MKNLDPIRDAFGKALVRIAKKNKNIICISPDLKQATKLSYFFQSIQVDQLKLVLLRQM